MAQITYTPNTQVPTGLTREEQSVLEFWYWNNPVDLKPSKFHFKVPIPEPAGPKYPFPIDKTTFPLLEFDIPILHEGTFRRVAIWIKPEPTDEDLKYIAYATLALMYKFPDYRITSALMLCIRATDKQIASCASFGIGLYLVPLVINIPK